MSNNEKDLEKIFEGLWKDKLFDKWFNGGNTKAKDICKKSFMFGVKLKEKKE